MLLALASVVAFLPENPSFDYSGMPYLRGSAGIETRTHAATIELEKGFATITSTTVFKNMSGAKVTATLVVPRRRIGDAMSGMPVFVPAVVWDKTPLTLRPLSARGSSTPLEGKAVGYTSDLGATVTINPGATHSVRLTVKLPEGKCGYEKKQRVLGYVFDGGSTIGQTNLAFRAAGKAVFNLPKPFPDWPWQVGAKGAFVRMESFAANGDIAHFTYYPGGFDPIGD